MKLLVRNLDRSTTEAELRALCEPHGAVQSCTIVKDIDTGQSKGFGFVVMPKRGNANGAMKALNRLVVAGSKLRVKEAVDKPSDSSDTAMESDD
ncbi:MAG: RNA-binding protein [Proteobacteria bacterium]|nr:RNA-binding protein [Pseudomonadota bacterium]